MHGTHRIRKAAILLLSLPEDQAVDLLARLEPDQARQVVREIAKNQAISPQEQQQVVLEFAGVDPSSLGAARGGQDVAEQLVTKLLRAPHTTLTRLRRLLAPRPLEFLRDLDTKKLLALISAEHPQTIALV